MFLRFSDSLRSLVYPWAAFVLAAPVAYAHPYLDQIYGIRLEPQPPGDQDP